MRIVHIICGPGAGGAEMLVRDMAMVMLERGHQLHIVFLQTAAESGRDDSFANRFLDNLKQKGISYEFIGKRSRRNPFLGIFKIRRMVKAFKPDIIHAHLYWPLLFLSFVRGIPVVFTKHSIQLGAPGFVVKILLRRVAAFVAICRACEEKFKSIADKRLVNIDNGTSFKSKPKNMSFDDGPVKLLYVGRLFPVKNVDMILHCCKIIYDANFLLRIAGEGPEINRLVLLAKNLGVDNKVIFLGNVSNIDELMNESDVFLLSSLSEGLPISLIEASLSGLPCIVTDVGGCKEVIERCNNGFSIPAGDVATYAEKLKSIIEDAELRHKLSMNAKRYSDHYSIDRVVDEHIKLYTEIL